MADDLTFDTSPPALAEECVRVSPLVRRIVAGNPGPITFTGTCSYIVGHGNVAIIDPGPDLPDHVEALLHAVRGETVTHILVTHTHKDHSPAAAAIKAATGAAIVGCAPHYSARPLFTGEFNTLEASSDKDYEPDQELNEGNAIEGPGWTLEALATPGHMANHLAFALPEEKTLFSGDHVMAWSTTVVAPPDGSMSAFMASLDKLKGRKETLYWPGHGGPVQEPQRFVRALIHHRRQREASSSLGAEELNVELSKISLEPEAKLCFSLHPPVTDQRLKALEKQVPSRPGAPLLSDEQWRALKEICKTT